MFLCLLQDNVYSANKSDSYPKRILDQLSNIIFLLSINFSEISHFIIKLILLTYEIPFNILCEQEMMMVKL